MDLQERWEAHATDWIAWARARAFTFADRVDRGGLSMTFHSEHRPIESYFLALEEAGLLIETLREPRVPDVAVKSERSRRWQRLPLFLHLRARRPKP
jgi:hypothetical protein